MSDYLTKRYDVKECATHIVYWVNLNFEVRNLIDASTDLHIVTHTNVCQLDVFCDRLKFCSTACLDCCTGQNKGRYREKSSYSYSSHNGFGSRLKAPTTVLLLKHFSFFGPPFLFSCLGGMYFEVVKNHSNLKLQIRKYNRRKKANSEESAHTALALCFDT